MGELSVGGSGPEWSVFTRRNQEGQPVVVRSRADHEELWAFALTNRMARLRCIPTDNSVDDAGMPRNTAVLEEYEDALVAQLEQSKAEAYLLAVVTGAGSRDFFFAMARREDISDAIKQIWRYRPFRLQVGWLNGPTERLLATLAP